MEIIETGHQYLLDGLDGGDAQILTFMKRVGEGFPFNHGKPHGGTNCQEVLRALIDRTRYLQSQKPCAETEAIIASLQTALLLFELRAARLHKHTLSLVDLMECVRLKPCSVCGHINCEVHTPVAETLVPVSVDGIIKTNVPIQLYGEQIDANINNGSK